MPIDLRVFLCYYYGMSNIHEQSSYLESFKDEVSGGKLVYGGSFLGLLGAAGLTQAIFEGSTADTATGGFVGLALGVVGMAASEAYMSYKEQ